MARGKWLDRTQPQTLYSATILLYINAALALLSALLAGGAGYIGLVLIAGEVAGGWGVANEKKWGFWLAAVVAALMLVFAIVTIWLVGAFNLISLLFDVALVALLFHPQSTAYRRTWFK
ncbi:MAG: hypothetical protein ACYCUG_09210 [Acidimicrobiales bacterium]